MWGIAIVGCFAAVIALIPPVGRLAWRIGAVDVPRDWRRMHTDSVPRAGGIAMLAAIGACWLLFCPHTVSLAAGLAGGLAVFCIGLADDIRPLPAGARLGVQLLAATVAAIGSGTGADVGLFPAVLWLVALTNAHNMIDGLDGLFAGTATVEGVGIALVLALSGAGDRALQPLLISAACLGFLRYNRPPAKIFAGDCGSGAVGFLLGFSALPALEAPVWRIGILAPLFVFAYPLTDMTAAVVRRVLGGKSPFAADRAHLHHRISAMGLSVASTAAVLVALTAVLTLCGVLLTREEYALGAVGGALGAVLFLLVTRYALVRSAYLHGNGAKRRKNVRNT